MDRQPDGRADWGARGGDHAESDAFPGGGWCSTRGSILLSLAGLFVGPVPTVWAAAITAAFRLSQGGVGAWTGVAVILFSAGAGLAWRRLRRQRRHAYTWLELYIFGLGVHVGMLLLMLTLPTEIARQVLGGISLPVLLIYPIGTILFGMLLVQQDKRLRAERGLRKSEEMLKAGGSKHAGHAGRLR